MYWRCPVPNLLAYDPAFAYEIAVIIQDGIKRMYVDQESIFYYLTVTNEPLAMPGMPEGKDVKDGILKGLYRFRTSTKKDSKLRAQLFGSGTIMYEVLKAQQILEEKYAVCGGCLECDQLQAACTAMATTAIAGTCCIRAKRRECRLSPSR